MNKDEHSALVALVYLMTKKSDIKHIFTTNHVLYYWQLAPDVGA